MAQDIVANADAFGNDIKSTGHATVYGIYFDTGKSEVKSESQAAVQEVAKLLSSDPGLKLLVVGHTDSVGQIEANMKLSRHGPRRWSRRSPRVMASPRPA